MQRSKLSIIISAFLLFLIIPEAFAFELEVSASKTSVIVSEDVSFTCAPKGGNSPYKYSWNFDDVATYKNGEAQSQSPTHAFEYLGLHKVWVTVTDSGGSEARAVLLIDVRITANENRLNVTNASDVGSGNALYNDGTNASENSNRISSIINNYYDNTNGLTLYFPTGIYKFKDSGEWENSPDKRYAIRLPNHSKIIIEGDRDNRPILEFYNTKTQDGASRDAMFYRNKTTGYLLLRRIIFKWNGSSGIENYDLQQLLAEPDDVSAGLFVTIEDSNIEDFSQAGNWENVIMRRCNVNGFGRFHGWGSNQGFAQALYGNDYTLFRQNYVADGNSNCYNTSQGVRCGHSKLWYAQSLQYAYVIENYGDSEHAERSQDFIVFKQGSQDIAIKGNLFKNSKSTFIQLGKYDSPADDITVENNRLINSDSNSTMLVYSSNTDILFNNNFTVENAGGFLQAGDASKCSTGADATGIIYSDNIGGFGDGTPIASDKYATCGGSPFSDITNGGGNSSTNNLFKSTDPAGWYDSNGYVDPGELEFSSPTNLSGSIEGSGSNVTLRLSASDTGSGLGSKARFPYRKGGLMQFSNDGVKWSEVRPYNETSNWVLGFDESVYARFRDRDGNWSEPVMINDSDSIKPAPPKNLYILFAD